jgi:hypothetical protein
LSLGSIQDLDTLIEDAWSTLSRQSAIRHPLQIYLIYCQFVRIGDSGKTELAFVDDHFHVASDLLAFGGTLRNTQHEVWIFNQWLTLLIG